MNISRLSVLALATTIAVLVPVSAEARSYVGNDSSGDVVAYDGFEDNTATKVADETSGDIVRTAVVHRKKRVDLAMSFRELAGPTEDRFVGHIFRVGGKKRSQIRTVSVFAVDGRPNGLTEMEKENGDGVKCRGLRWGISYDTDTVRVSIPRRCLGQPEVGARRDGHRERR